MRWGGAREEDSEGLLRRCASRNDNRQAMGIVKGVAWARFGGGSETAPYSPSGDEDGRDFLAFAPRVLRSSTWARRLPGPVFSLPRAPS